MENQIADGLSEKARKREVRAELFDAISTIQALLTLGLSVYANFFTQATAKLWFAAGVGWLMYGAMRGFSLGMPLAETSDRTWRSLPQRLEPMTTWLGICIGSGLAVFYFFRAAFK